MIGDVLTSTTGTWDGIGPTVYAYQWMRDGVAIAGATSNTYTLVEADTDCVITCQVTATNPDGSADATSNEIVVIVAPANTVAPVVSGDVEIGSVLSTTDGTWTGSEPIVYTYQWLRDSVAIGGATANTYTLVEADAETDVSCTVTATNAGGNASATSNALEIPSGAFNPAHLGASLRMWLNPDDAEGRTLVGNEFSALLDRSGNGRDWTQATSASRPVTRTVNGRTAVDFDGSNDFLQRAETWGSIFGTGESEVFAVVLMDALASDAASQWTAPQILTDGSGWHGEALTQSGHQSWRSDGANKETAYNKLPLDTAQVVQSRISAGSLITQRNTFATSAGVAIGTLQNVAAATCYLGRNYNGTGFINGVVCEVIVTDALTTEQRANVQEWLISRWGVSLNVNLFKDGTHTRSTVKYVQSDQDSLVQYATNARAIENRGDGNFLSMGGARSNIARISAPSGSWGVTSATYTVSAQDGPLGAGTAGQAAFDAVADARVVTLRTTVPADNANVMLSCWVRTASGSGSVRFAVRQKTAGYVYSSDIAISETWTRIEATVNVGAGASDPFFGLANGTDAVARTIYFAAFQAENGAYWPSSYIDVPSTVTVTCGADVLTLTPQEYPASFLTDGFTFTFAPDFSSAEFVASNRSMCLLNIDDGGTNRSVQLRIISGNAYALLVTPNGVNQIHGPITWSRAQALAITVEPNVGSTQARITVAGATTGNGSSTSSPGNGGAYGAGRIRIGAYVSGALDPFFGRFAEYITPVAA